MVALIQWITIVCGSLVPVSFEQAAVSQPDGDDSLREIAALKRAIRTQVQRKAGSRFPPEVTASMVQPYDYYRCVKDYDAAKGDSRRLYQAVERHLAVAAELLRANRPPEVRRSGLGVCYFVARCTSERLKDEDLASAICQAWLMPHLDVADDRHWKLISRLTILQTSTMIYLEAKEFSQAEAAARIWIETAHNRNAADAGRLRLAQSLDAQGKIADAIVVLEAIEDQASLSGAKKMIPALRLKLEHSPPATQVREEDGKVRK